MYGSNLLCGIITSKGYTMTEERKPGLDQYNIEGKELEAFLGPLEASIMEAIWSSKDNRVTVREIYETLKNNRKLAYTTIQCTMDRLYEKHLLDRQVGKGKRGFCYVYWPVLKKQTFQKSAVREVLSSLINNFGDVVANCLVDESCLNEQDRKALRDQLDKSIQKKE